MINNPHQIHGRGMWHVGGKRCLQDLGGGTWRRVCIKT